MRPRSCAVTEHRCIPDVPTGLARHFGGVSVRRICSMKFGPCDVKAIVECATSQGVTSRHDTEGSTPS